MRILAIRGKNLASLRGEFEVRLDRPPISSSNLFSISGPTGSGKSTLLDALCLALYGKTPRLSDEGGHAIGAPGEDEKLRLKSNDARALLSRGTADGFAEVDFQGADGKRYKATWRVHRARNLGRFQTQTMALVDLDSGDTISSQITEVRQAIEMRVGFTFEEFKRTVLLPQFEFTKEVATAVGINQVSVPPAETPGLAAPLPCPGHEELEGEDLVEGRLGQGPSGGRYHAVLGYRHRAPCCGSKEHIAGEDCNRIR